MILTRTAAADNSVTAQVTITDVTTNSSDYVFTPGALDPSFDQAQAQTEAFPRKSCNQTARSLHYGKHVTSYNGVSRSHIARLNPNGSLDGKFDPGTGADGLVSAIALQIDGKIIIGGDFLHYNGSSGSFKRIARLYPDGSLDPTFIFDSDGTGANGSVLTVVVQPDGNILAGGTFTTFNNSTANRIARLDSNGLLDASFNGGGMGANNTVRAIALQGDGKIIIGGDFSGYASAIRNRIARLNVDGSVDTNYNPGFRLNPGAVSAITVQPDGRAIIGGGFGQGNIARINLDGTFDAPFNSGTGANLAVSTITLQLDGKIIIGGSFTTYNGVAGNRIARLNPNGSIDTTFNPGTGANVDVTATAVQGDGKIVFGGNFTSYNGVARNGIARASGDLFVTWAAGDATNKALLLPIVDDSLVEGNETLTLTLTSVSGGATLGAISTQTLTILDNDQSITFGPLSNKNFGDPPFTLNATASSGLPVSFQVIAGPATINGNALTITGVGTVTVRALQTGNSSYNAANPVDQSFVIFRGNQTIAFDPLTDKTFGNAPFIVSALASSGLPVSFQILSGPATVTGHTVTITGTGLVTRRASLSGDANYNAASPVDRSFLVSEPTGLPVITSPLTASSLVDQQFTYQFEATGATS